jgi:hypothetical protein
MKTYIFIFLFVLIGICFVSCKNDNKTINKEVLFSETLTGNDTVAVEKLVQLYFSHLMDGNHYDAASILYRPNPENIEYKPELLDNEQIEQVVKSMKAIPVVGYNIEYIKFNQSYNNEVMVRVIMFEGKDGLPDVCSKVFFKPINYLGTWFLTVMDSNSGDKQLVDSDERKEFMLQNK